MLTWERGNRYLNIWIRLTHDSEDLDRSREANELAIFLGCWAYEV